MSNHQRGLAPIIIVLIVIALLAGGISIRHYWPEIQDRVIESNFFGVAQINGEGCSWVKKCEKQPHWTLVRECIKVETCLESCKIIPPWKWKCPCDLKCFKNPGCYYLIKCKEREVCRWVYECKPYIKVLSPNGGEKLEIGKTYPIKWDSSRNVKQVTIILYKGKAYQKEIFSNISNTKSIVWTVDKDLLSGDDYKIRIKTRVNDQEIFDESDNYFSIVGGCQNECSPNGLKRCSNNGYQICGNYDEDNCLEWSSVTACPPNTVCQNGECIQQKCADGTPYGQCSTNKPKYCDNGNLVDRCSICGCPSGQQCQLDGICKTIISCQNSFKIVLLYLSEEENAGIQEKIQKMEAEKKIYEEMFNYAGREIVKFDFSYTPVSIKVTNDNRHRFIIFDETGRAISINFAEVTKEFYKNNPDDFHFVIIFHNIELKGAGGGIYYLTLQNKISGNGLSIFDSSGEYGSSGRLLGMVHMGRFNPGIPHSVGKLLLHEISHQWGVFIGDKKNEGDLVLRDWHGVHWERGLNVGYDPLGFTSKFKDNGNGTFTVLGIDYWSEDAPKQTYSDLTLYLMGLRDPKDIKPILWLDIDDGIAITPGTIITPNNWKYIEIEEIINRHGKINCMP